jgi:hypothetical protein
MERHRIWVEDKINRGYVGNRMPSNMNVSTSGADPPKNNSGSTGTTRHRKYDLKLKCFKVGSGCCIAVDSFSNAELLILSIEICDMRSWPCSNAAMTFSTLLSFTPYRQIMLIGKGGQISSDVLVGVVSVQTIRRPRRRGDPKITYLHLRHTCISAFHLQVSKSLRILNGSSL